MHYTLMYALYTYITADTLRNTGGANCIGY